jgi:hypothetical protein
MAKKPEGDPASAIGDILKGVLRREAPKPHQLEGRKLAQRILAETLGPAMADRATVVLCRTGQILIEADSAPLFQELDGFYRQSLLDAFRAGGLQVREVRVRLKRA